MNLVALFAQLENIKILQEVRRAITVLLIEIQRMVIPLPMSIQLTIVFLFLMGTSGKIIRMHVRIMAKCMTP